MFTHSTKFEFKFRKLVGDNLDVHSKRSHITLDEHEFNYDLHLHCRKVTNQLHLIQIHLKLRCFSVIFQIWLLEVKNFEFKPVYTHHKTEIDYNLREVDDDFLPSVNVVFVYMHICQLSLFRRDVPHFRLYKVKKEEQSLFLKTDGKFNQEKQKIMQI